VGFKVYREVRDFAPPGITSGELVVALIIADDAGEESRRSWIKSEELCYRTRMKPSTVRANLAKLAARGLEFRVIHGRDKNGNPVYAVKGKTPDYLVPDFLLGASPLAPKAVDNPGVGASGLAPNGTPGDPVDASAVAVGASAVAPKRLQGASRLAPLSSEDLNHLNIPSLDCPVITTSVEGTCATGQVKTSDFAASVQGTAQPLPPVKLTQQEEFERQVAGLREFEMKNSIQESK
jgi:hypothetical protein